MGATTIFSATTVLLPEPQTPATCHVFSIRTCGCCSGMRANPASITWPCSSMIFTPLSAQSACRQPDAYPHRPLMAYPSSVACAVPVCAATLQTRSAPVLKTNSEIAGGMDATDAVTPESRLKAQAVPGQA